MAACRCAENIASWLQHDIRILLYQWSADGPPGRFGRPRTRRGGESRRTGTRIDEMDASSFKRRNALVGACSVMGPEPLALRRWSHLAVSARVVTVSSTTRRERTCVVAHAWRPSAS